MFNSLDIRSILEQYNLGKLILAKSIYKNDSISYCQEIDTSTGVYILKANMDFKSDFADNYEVNSKLAAMGIPVLLPVKSKTNSYVTTYKNMHISIFRYIEESETEWKNLNIKETESYGQCLAKIHNVSQNLKNIATVDSFDAVHQLINRLYDLRQQFGSEINNIIEFMKCTIETSRCRETETITGCFPEFNPGHVWFKDNKVSCIIDMQIIRDYAFYDIGSSMTACFSPDGTKFYPDKIQAFVASYHKHRQLSDWELKNLHKAFSFGILKYGIWGFIDTVKGVFVEDKYKIDESELNKIRFLMEFPNVQFDNLM